MKMMIMFVMIYSIVCLFLPTVVSGLQMPLTENNLRAPLLVDIDITKMNGEIKKYIDNGIDKNVQETCYQEIDKVVTNRHTDLSQDIKEKFQDLEQKLNGKLTKQLESKTSHIEQRLDSKSTLLTNTLTSLETEFRSKFEQLEQRLLKENEELKKQLEEKSKDQKLKILTDNDRLHTRITNELSEEKNKYQNMFSSLENGFKSKFNRLESHLKNKLDSFKTHMETKFTNHKDRLDTEVVGIKTRLTSNEKQVAVTACARGGTYKNNVRIPFPNVVTSYGITNLSTLKTNGLFTCESDGLYIVSVTIMSNQKDGKFYIYKNNNDLVLVYLQNKESQYYYSGSNTAVVLMSVNDTISVKPQYDNSYVVGNHYSCITVVKVK